MDVIHLSIPLAGMDPTRKATPDERETAQDRAFRMLSEGELFYVDTDLHEDVHSAKRHDHGHVGGVSLEVISESIAARKPGQIFKPESIADTEAATTSRSTSQDSNDADNTWSVQAADAFGPRLSLKEAQEWDYSKLDDPALEHRARERSFSEPQLRRCHNQFDRVPQAHEWGSSSTRHGWMASVNEAAASTAWPSSRSSSSLAERRCDGNVCVDAAAGLQRLWNNLFGGSERGIHRVECMSPHLSSCTSTKTFEVSSSDCDRDALARLGVVPDTGRGLGGAGSMTFTMHIAGHRVVRTMLGQHAEFEVRVKGGGRRWSRWQRFSKFKTVAACVDKDPPSMKAWRRVLKAKPRFRCLDPEYLAQKCNLLEVFLQKVMFAMPTPALLIHFVSQE